NSVLSPQRGDPAADVPVEWIDVGKSSGNREPAQRRLSLPARLLVWYAFGVGGEDIRRSRKGCTTKWKPTTIRPQSRRRTSPQPNPHLTAPRASRRLPCCTRTCPRGAARISSTETASGSVS